MSTYSFYDSFYDEHFMKHNITVKQGFNGVYYVYVDHSFLCSADTMREVDEEIDEYLKEHALKTLGEVI